ncbi:uncharacterized protein PV09_04573 [Verruconis gallopava]|uniref:Phosphoglycerate mutase n=1 Tax=Verruconis gallopava TaxID=253628 RepID=A0A0D1XNW8_9PEZI|nr:uncharacterized protein PV09_04573 [Verruconis gallopava]KIW04271.1 hypothetical protein PV09_04573 [Verruconis gallopava]
MLRRKRKIIHFIRHAESDHNIAPFDTRLRDPYLSQKGRIQAEALGEQFPHLQDVDLIVCSPMKRAITTALLVFKKHLLSSKKQLIALPELQELSGKPCDTGSSLAELLTEFREEPLDLNHVPHNWESKDGAWSPTEQRTLARMTRARAWLRSRPETNIVVVGHAHCMQLLVRDAPEEYYNDGIEAIRLGLLPEWKNCEWRSFSAEVHQDHVLWFDELRASKKAKSRGENVPRLTNGKESRKSSQTSSEMPDEFDKNRSRSVWSSKSSQLPFPPDTSPDTVTRKARTWPNEAASSPSSPKQTRKLLSAIRIRK